MSTSTPIHTDPSDVALTDPSRTGASRTGLSKPVAALIVAGVLGASAVLGRRNAPDPSHPKTRRWYKRLDKPGFTPPDAVFGAVWPVLETGLAVGGYRLMRAPADPRRNAAVGLWLLNTAMVGGWTELFFRKRALETSAIAAGGMVVTGAAYVATAAKVDRPAAGLGVPFVAWLGFATVLATRISQRNDTRR
ncbi:TspO/MBR related protein [Sphingomonas sp. PP-F2F-A104-K0414]|uniref:TspO/MBR family protein n=1 Tax=Sphingomonas sp. PP-F2F-A104-K0414 TaxID=2135661 RepID=UPI001044A82C|nr:TspO/MBR family protein [Sphingomonas sp. PP-F2F-A104-K0414]TCP98904.1 TspO/MBR related protein [Sphingomonas sp. PP-F2F-A104-K0414]